LAESHEIAAEYVVKRRSIGWIPHQQFLNESDCLVGDTEALGDDVVAVLDLLVGRVGILSLKGRNSIIEGI
jgi:hypothetical protein